MKELTTYQCPECQFPILMSLPEANELRVHTCPHCESPYILVTKKGDEYLDRKQDEPVGK